MVATTIQISRNLLEDLKSRKMYGIFNFQKS